MIGIGQRQQQSRDQPVQVLVIARALNNMQAQSQAFAFRLEGDKPTSIANSIVAPRKAHRKNLQQACRSWSLQSGLALEAFGTPAPLNTLLPLTHGCWWQASRHLNVM